MGLLLGLRGGTLAPSLLTTLVPSLLDGGAGGEGWSHVGTTNAFGGLGDKTPTLPVETQAGDLIVLVVADDTTVTTPSGYTQRALGTGDPSTVLYSKIAGAGEGSPTVTSCYTVICSVFRNPGATIAFDTALVTQSPAGTASTAGGITVASDGSLLIHIAINIDGLTHTPSTGFTEPVNGDAGTIADVAISYKLDQGAGATGSIAGTWSGDPIAGHEASLTAFSES